MLFWEWGRNEIQNTVIAAAFNPETMERHSRCGDTLAGATIVNPELAVEAVRFRKLSLSDSTPPFNPK
jgi:hypothetical protein